MRIKTVSIQGFLSIGEITLNLESKGTTLVEGDNQDSTADSNGAGKSSIFEAIYWCLYGSTRRGITGDDVVNRHTKTGTMVFLVFEAKGKVFSVRRSRKSKDHGTNLDLWEGVKYESLTKGTMRDTQALIEEIVGLSPTAFQKMVFFGQGDVKAIAEMSDAELKMVFEQGLGLTQIYADFMKVAGYRKSIEAKLSKAVADHKSATMMAEVLRSGLEEKRAAVEEFKEAKTKRFRALVDEYKDQATKLNEASELKKEREKNREKVSLEIASLKAKADAFVELKAKYDKKESAVMSEIAVYTDKAARVRRDMVKLLEDIERISKAKGSECELCGFVMDEAAVTNAVGVIESQVDEKEKEFGEESGKLVVLTKKKKDMEDIVSPFMADFKELLAKIKGAEASAEVIERELAWCAANEAAYKGAMDIISMQIEEEKSKDGSELKERLAKEEEKVAQYEKNLGELEDNAITATLELETAKALESALGNGGMKSLVFDRVTPELNRVSNDLLAILDPETSVEISTITTLKSGERREKFSVSVETASGAKVFSGHSGGEKQKVNLAVSLAFNIMMRGSCSSAPNLLVLDEPFEALDAGSSDQVMEMLAGLSVDNVWLITHNQSVKDLIPNRITVRKKGGITFLA